MMFRKTKTVGVVAICHGYPDKIQGWIDSVRKLERKPDQIVLVLYSEISIENFDLTGIKVVYWDNQYNFSQMLNYGFENCETDFVAWIGIDDRYRPNALNKVKKTKADVIALGFQFDSGETWIPKNITKERILRLEHNLIPCGSIVKRSIWEQNKFDTSAVPIDDWAFWIGTAKLNCKYECTNEINVDYEFIGHNHPDEMAAREQIKVWYKKKFKD